MLQCMACGHRVHQGGSPGGGDDRDTLSQAADPFASFGKTRSHAQPPVSGAQKPINAAVKVFFMVFFFILAVVSYGAVDYMNNMADGSDKPSENPQNYQPVEAMVTGLEQDLVLQNPVVRTHSTDEHLLRITYQYTVDGRIFSGDRYSVNNVCHSAILITEHNTALNRYQIGKTITVYYNPDNPALSFISKQAKLQPRSNYYISPWLPAIFFFCMAALCIPGLMPALEKAFNKVQYGG